MLQTATLDTIAIPVTTVNLNTQSLSNVKTAGTISNTNTMAVNATDLYNYVNNIISSYNMTMLCSNNAINVGGNPTGSTHVVTGFT